MDFWVDFNGFCEVVARFLMDVGWFLDGLGKNDGFWMVFGWFRIDVDRF